MLFGALRTVVVAGVFLFGLLLGLFLGSSYAAKSQWDYLVERGVVSDDPEWIEEHLGRRV